LHLFRAKSRVEFTSYKHNDDDIVDMIRHQSRDSRGYKKKLLNPSHRSNLEMEVEGAGNGIRGLGAISAGDHPAWKQPVKGWKRVWHATGLKFYYYNERTSEACVSSPFFSGTWARSSITCLGAPSALV